MGGVVERLAEVGVAVIRVAGVKALADRPLSALAVAGVDVKPSPNMLQAMMSAVTELEAMLAESQSILMVDDADDLDPTTVGAIAAVHARTHTPVVTTSRPAGHRSPEASTLVAELQPGVRISLAPLRFDEVHRLVHELLGGPVDPAAVSRIAAKSGGLPGLVAAMVNTARIAGRLAPRRGLWIARGDLWTTPLSQCAEPFLAGLDDECLDAVTLLSVAGTLNIDAAQALLDAEILAQLDDAGLLKILPEGSDAVVGIFPPLVAEYVTHEGSATRHLLARKRLESVDSPGSRAHTQDSRAASAPGSDPILNRRLAQRWQDQTQDARSSWDADPSAANAAPLIEALLITRARGHEIGAVIAGTKTCVADERSLAAFTTWSALFDGLACGKVEPARDALRERRPAVPRFDGLLRATDGYLQLITRSVPSSEDLADAADGEDRLSQDALVVVRAEALLAAGQAYAALDLLQGYTSADDRLVQCAEVARELALLYTCDFEGAVGSALEGVERARIALDPGAVEAHAWVAGFGLALQGRLIELDELMSSVLALAPTPAHQSHYQAGLLSLAADAARWQGRNAYARTLAMQSSALGTARGPHPGMAADGVAARIRDADDVATTDELWDIADERLGHGFLAAGLVAGVSAIERTADPVAAQRLLEVAASCDAPLLSHLGAYAVAIASGDGDQLAELEPRLLKAGLRLYAVRTAVARSMSMLASGDAVGAAEHADNAWNQAGLRGRDLCGLFRRFDRAVSLTAREREVAILVARGMSSQEIAEMKFLSVRTVENHIFSACRKVGVDTREGLAHAAQTWLSCAIE